MLAYVLRLSRVRNVSRVSPNSRLGRPSIINPEPSASVGRGETLSRPEENSRLTVGRVEEMVDLRGPELEAKARLRGDRMATSLQFDRRSWGVGLAVDYHWVRLFHFN